MKNNWICQLLPAAIALILAGAAAAQDEKSVIIVVNTSASSWADGAFADRLNSVIAEHNGIEVADANDSRELLDLSKGQFNKQQAIDQGIASEHRFVLWCDVKKEEMRIEKGFSFPFLARQRRVTAHMEIEYRIVDCYRGRLISSEKLKMKSHGPSTMQYLDFTDADPNLYLSYSERKEMFDKLETEAADKMTEVFAEVARQR
ncbi:MAG: hypothetical protein WBP29_05370 [Candidatus Zixiibacteriota bacterium]